MIEWTKLLIKASTSFAQAFKLFDQSGSDTLIVTDGSREPLGLVTEVGTRRALLAGARPNDAVANFVEPLTAGVKYNSRDTLEAKDGRGALVLVDNNGKATGIATLIDASKQMPADTIVVLMAGGLGTRLYPLTNDCPKPLLPVHGKPLLEITVGRLAALGIKHICMTLGYRGEMIEKHFGDGSKWKVNIEYVHEKEKLGTCGALRLLKQRPGSPVIVMNGDVITQIDFPKLLGYHRVLERKATMCTYHYEVRIPYGVITARGNILKTTVEKPVHYQWINAGVYVLNPDVIDLIPPTGAFDMPSLLQLLQSQGDEISLYPLRELWIDIGSIEEYERANLTEGIITKPSVSKQVEVQHGFVSVEPPIGKVTLR